MHLAKQKGNLDTNEMMEGKKGLGAVKDEGGRNGGLGAGMDEGGEKGKAGRNGDCSKYYADENSCCCTSSTFLNRSSISS